MSAASPPHLDAKPLPGPSDLGPAQDHSQSHIHGLSLSPQQQQQQQQQPQQQQQQQQQPSHPAPFGLNANQVFAAGDVLRNHLKPDQFGAPFDFALVNLPDDPSLDLLAGEDGASPVFASPDEQQRLSSPSKPRIASAHSIPPAASPPQPSQPPQQRQAGHSRSNPSIGGSEDDALAQSQAATAPEDSLADEFGLNFGRGDGTDSGSRPKDDAASLAPSWSELKTKAGKERKRLPLACIACRRKKIRCSGEKPACKHCSRARIPCVYKVTTRKAAPRTDYMAMLDKRLKRMEERIIKIVPKRDQDGRASSVPRASVKLALPGTSKAGKGGSRKRGAEEAFGTSDLDAWVKAPPNPSLDSGLHASALLTIHEAEENKLLKEGLSALPSKQIQQHLAEVFFESVYGQAYHVLHKPSYMSKLRAGTLPPVLILSVCAVAARFSTHPALYERPEFLRGEEWAATARDIVTKRYEWPNITILICLIILGLHEFATCQGGRSWALGGQAIRMAFALQLHKDLPHDPVRPNIPLSFVDREIRRRTMWACFLMDRFISSGTNRPTFIKEETLKIPLPVKEKNFQLDIPAATENLQGDTVGVDAIAEDADASNAADNMGVAAYMIKAILIWGRVIHHLNQGGKNSDNKFMWETDSEYTRLVKEAEDMAASLPDTLVYNLDNLHIHDTECTANQFIFLHIAIQQNILFLNRFAISPISPSANADADPPTSFVTLAGAKAFGAANRISEILKDAETYHITAPFIGYCAFLSSTVQVFGLFSGNPTMEANSSRNLATNFKFLTKIKRYWGMFNFMIENLRDQYRTCADKARRGNENPSSTTPIFQYGDWFEIYPHGVSKSDFVDPAIYKAKEKGEDAALEQKSDLHTVEEFLQVRPQAKNGSSRSNFLAAAPMTASDAAALNRTKPRGSDPHDLGLQLGPLDPHMTAEQVNLLRRLYPRGFMAGGNASASPGFDALLGGGGGGGGGSGISAQSGAFGANLAALSPVAMDHGPFGGMQHFPHDLSPHGLMPVPHAGQGDMLQSPMLRNYNNSGNMGGMTPTAAAAAAAMLEGLMPWTGAEHQQRVSGALARAGLGPGSAGDPAAMAAIMQGLAQWEGTEPGAGPSSSSRARNGSLAGNAQADGGPRGGPGGSDARNNPDNTNTTSTEDSNTNNNNHTNPHELLWGSGHEDPAAAFFMPFNLDGPPDVPDFSGLGGMNGFEAMFGSGAGSGAGGL
ncbi:fungal-specific transcription factor domain-domain-containing protein [Coniella lustricola]|uniref:Fungal-specific transcription factor domain-domain-containing protein n=1 Tax=Coniella lustricola TaxID=2025994 RepID=A0A2T2ZT55_9PEZI|nr:fungal-specific transcription factor domain-domain-containing protein [Coniella lustricola]